MLGESTPSKWRTLAFTSLGHLVNDGWTAFIPVVADLANQRQTPLIVVALMSIAFYSTAALLSFHVGRFADRSGRPGRMIALGIGVLSLSFVGFFLTFQFSGSTTVLSVAVIALSVLAGFGTAFYHPISATVLRSVFSPTESGKAMGVNGSFGAIGSTMVAPLFFLFAAYEGQVGAVLAIASLGVIAAIGIGFGLGGSRAVVSRKSSHSSGSWRSALNRSIAILTAITAVRSISTTGVTFWLATYLTRVKGEGIGPLLGLTLAALYIGAIPGQLTFGAFVDRFDKRYVLGIGSAGASLCILGYVYSSGYVALIAISLFGFFSYSSFPTLLSLASEYVPRTSSSSANAVVWGLGTYGGNVAGPGLVGTIVGESFGLFNSAFVFLAILGLVGAVITPLMPRPDQSVVVVTEVTTPETTG